MKYLLPCLLAIALSACEREAAGGANADERVQAAFARELGRLRTHAESVDALFQPLPLLRAAQEAALRRYDNDEQLTAARRLGVAPNTTESQLDELVRARRLVRLADTTDLWVVRRLDHSVPYLTPDAEALLREVAQRFQGELARIGAPRYRVEVTSVLRSAEDQAALRRVNPNAAAGESTHQYGTTFDVAYSAFAAPAGGSVEVSLPEASWLEPHLAWMGHALLETVAARRSRELMAILGGVLIEMQQEGRVMVTLERLQPVYHMTVAQRVRQ